MKEENQRFLIHTPIKIMSLGLLMMAGAGGALMFVHYLLPERSLEAGIVLAKIGFYILSVPIIMFQFLYLSGALKRLSIEPKLSIFTQLFLFLIFFPFYNYLTIIILNTDLHFVSKYLTAEGIVLSKDVYLSLIHSLQCITFIFYIISTATALLIRALIRERKMFDKEAIKKALSDDDFEY